MDRDGNQGKFHTLDGLRGIAAILVVGRHAGALGYTTPESFLAVDLFFALSGFVIAMAYDRRLAAGSFVARFFLTRWIRLYPLYLLGFVLGLAASAFAGAPILGSAVVAGIFMIPLNPWMLGSVGTFNQPVWTLPLELFANAVYAAFFRWISVPVLIGVAALSGVGLIWSAYAYHNLDLGWSIDQLPVALSRLFFSFSIGVIFARTVGDRRRLRPLVAWMCIALAEGLLLFQPPASLQLVYELAAILIGFPALLLVACQSEPSRGAATLFGLGGTISYAIYTLHAPLSRLLIEGAPALGLGWTGGRWDLVLFMVILAIAAWLAHAAYDRPVRRLLTAALLPRRALPKTRPPLAEPHEAAVSSVG